MGSNMHARGRLNTDVAVGKCYTMGLCSQVPPITAVGRQGGGSALVNTSAERDSAALPLTRRLKTLREVQRGRQGGMHEPLQPRKLLRERFFKVRQPEAQSHGRVEASGGCGGTFSGNPVHRGVENNCIHEGCQR
jgi:hypothetical protein